MADLEGDEILEFDEIVHHQPSTTHEGSASSKAAMPAIISKEDNPLSRLPSLDLLERPDVNRKAGFTPEQLERCHGYWKSNYANLILMPKWLVLYQALW